MFSLGITLLLFSGLLRNVALAQEVPAIYINEIMWAKAEYIELFNAGSEEVSLEDWYIVRQDPDRLEEKTIVAFSSNDIIPANGYFLIESSENATEVPSNKIKGSLGLLDGGALLRLHAKDQKSIIDVANSLGPWFAGENNKDDGGFSMERTSPVTGGELAEAWQTSVGNIGGRVGTPGQENSKTSSPEPSPLISLTPTPTVVPQVYSPDIHINEFLPNPKGNDAVGEFIELVNTGSEPVDISEWVLDDVVDSGSAPFSIPDETSILGNGFIIFYRPQTKLSLNNDSDHVRLIRPDAVVQDDVSYTDTKEAHSYNRTDAEKYEKSSTITPGAANIITNISTPTPKPEEEKDTEKESEIAYDYSAKILINEFLPNPIGEDTELEFIEIKSFEKRNIKLFGWKLDDGDKGSAPYSFKKEDSIGAGKVLVLFRPKTKIALNNDKDSVRLLDPSGKVISVVSYDGKIVEGQSYNKNADGEFVWSEIPTPGKENTISIQETVTPTPKPKAIKKVSRSKVSSSSRVLSAVAPTTSMLPWPEQVQPEGLVSRSVVPIGSSAKAFTHRQGVFIFFGMGMAGMQFVSGIRSKEKIWQK